MAKKHETPIEIIENIHNQTMEEIMGERFATYAKYVIQDRAIPDVRDGLKPVQRRIIYSMYQNGNIFSRPTRKCAHTVGTVMGEYHPHGDSSIYEALVRMSQNWKVNAALIDFQGNNGSLDGDSPAAYRYTEARLSEIAEEMIRDINKETIDKALTFDDERYEPVVLPARFPNLLVNGTEGIAVGMATEIPTHNLREIIDAIIYRINHVRATSEDLMEFVQGPDFPTGGLIYKSNGLKDIYLTGRGRIEIASKTEIIDTPKEKKIIITEIPFKTVKIDLVHEIDMLRHNNILPGIQEVRDETDRNGLRIVVEVKKEAKIDIIHQYLMSKSSLKTGYSANMVAIVNGSPKTLTLLDYVDCYIDHQVDVITRRSAFDLEKNKSRLNIVNGLIKAISILDQVVATIKESKDKQDAKTNLQERFNFSEPQSEAIVMLQLYKLTNTDVTTLMNEKRSLEENIEFLQGILSDRNKLNRLLISDLKEISKKYGTPRKTQIVDKEETVTIDKRDLINKEEVMLAISRDGYIKYSTIKSYKSSGDNALPGMKDGDACVYLGKVMTTDYLLCFTNLGNYLYIPVHQVQETKWLQEGKHINYLVNLNPNEKIVRACAVEKFRNDLFVVLVSKNGQIKRVRLSDFQVVRYSKALVCMKLLGGDEVSDVTFTNGNSNLMLFSSDGNAAMYNENELPLASMRSGGVKGFAKLNKASVVAVISFGKDKVEGKALLITDKACIRIYDVRKTELSNRLGKTTSVFKSFKSDEHKLVYVKMLDTSIEKTRVHILNNMKEVVEINVDDYHLTPMDYYAHASIQIPAKSRLEIPFIEGSEYLDSKIVSDVPSELLSSGEEVKTEEISQSETVEKEEDLEKDDFPEKGYTQISIFDDDDLD